MLLSRTFIALLLLIFMGGAASAQGGREPGNWSARWIAPHEAPPNDAGVFHFRKAFDLVQSPEHFVVRVSGDNRYRLFVNGQQVSSGPARGDLLNWRFDTVDLAPYLRGGRNVISAMVWNWGDLRPLAQASYRTGFLLSGQDEAARVADTDDTWKAFWNRAYTFTKVNGRQIGGYYAAAPGENLDAARYPWGWETVEFDDGAWPQARAVDTAILRGTHQVGSAKGWQLVPRHIPPMEERFTAFSRVRRAEGVGLDNGFLTGERPLSIPARSRASVLIDQDHLTTGYPVVSASGGAGAEVTLTYAEALVDAEGRKTHRDRVEGLTIRGVRDTIRFDGGEQRSFQSLWLRTFRYVQMDIETGDEPLHVTSFGSIYSAYPFQERAGFDSDQAWIQPIWAMNWRMLRLSAWETFWDTPYYEQLQYIGDTRIEALLALYTAGDDRLVRNAIEQFDDSRSPEGITGSRYPSEPAQYIPPFSLWWIAMVHDYWMLRDDPAFVQQFLPGIRSVLDWFERHLDTNDMLGPMPWWSFLDWAPSWTLGVPPGAEDGHSTAFTLQFVYALQKAADMEEALGRKDTAARNRALAARLITAVRARAWNAARGLFIDALGQQSFSQHTNVLAVLTGAAQDKRKVMEHVLSDPDLLQATYYFRFYVDEAMNQAGLADQYIGRLGPWRDMIALGLTTTPETPEPTRSDSHAWSAHPNYHLLATVLGVRPAAPGFRTVAIRPALGSLQRASGRMPHPDGEIQVRLERVDATGVRGVIVLPAGVSGQFQWADWSKPLHPGRNRIDSPR